MAAQTTNNIVLPRAALKTGEGVVILPLKKWKRIEEDLEDLEMYRSESLAKEIEKRRKEKATVSLKRVLKKYHI